MFPSIRALWRGIILGIASRTQGTLRDFHGAVVNRGVAFRFPVTCRSSVVKGGGMSPSAMSGKVLPLIRVGGHARGKMEIDMNVKKHVIPVLLLLLFGQGIVFGKQRLTIVGSSSPPYLFEENGKVVGIDAEICRFIFDRLGVDYRLKIFPRARLMVELKKGSVDMGIGVSNKSGYDDYLYFPEVFTRNAEFVFLTNDKTKARYDAVSFNYIRDNSLIIGIVRGESYHERLWKTVLWHDAGKKAHGVYLEPAVNIEQNLKKLNYNRVNVVPVEEKTGLYTAGRLGLENITAYDFVAFFKPVFNVFSRDSDYKSGKYRDITALMKAYERVLADLRELPEFTDISNWDWSGNPAYAPRRRRAIKETAGKPVNIGFLAALSGTNAGWGKPGLTGVRMIVDEVNARGGLLVGGVRHPLRLHVYDDEADASKAMKGARELVEKHDVKFINAIGGACADATHPYLTRKRVVYASLIATDIRPDRPYLLAGGDVTPRIDMLRPWYHRNKNPKLKRWAVVSQDDRIGRLCQDWEVGAAGAEGWDVVYDGHFPTDTSDFSGVVADMLAAEPDVVSLNLTWPGFVPLILEQLYLQGYRGEISGNYMETEANLKKVPEAFHENIVDSFPLFNDPFWGEPSIQHDFYNRWMESYGPGAPEDVRRSMTGIDWNHMIMLEIWAFGAQLAESFDPDRIIAALRAQKSFPTILGNAVMAGKDMWGIQNMVSPPIPINETRKGVKRIQTIKRFEEWFQTHGEAVVDVVKSRGAFRERRK